MTAVVLVIVVHEQVPINTVYVCSDKEKNPPDVQAQCKRLTKHQWWSAYYEGKKP